MLMEFYSIAGKLKYESLIVYRRRYYFSLLYCGAYRKRQNQIKYPLFRIAKFPNIPENVVP